MLVTVITISYEIRANIFSGKWEGGGGWQLPKHRESGAIRKEIEQVLSTIQVMLFDSKKDSCTSYMYYLPENPCTRSLKMRKKISCPRKLPNLPSKTNGLSHMNVQPT